MRVHHAEGDPKHLKRFKLSEYTANRGRTGELLLVDQELWFSKTTCRNSTRWVRNLLDPTHAGNPVVDRLEQSGVPSRYIAFDNKLEHESRITYPRIKIVGVG